jgi:hypothetical protein
LHSVSAHFKQDKLTGGSRVSRNGRVVANFKKTSGDTRLLSSSKRLKSGATVYYPDADGKPSGLSGTLQYVSRKKAGKYGASGWLVKNQRSVKGKDRR